ncbi:GNAT family N-acetyltransferase [Streptomyces sp. NPDC026673]|uniref:GNAT family N-acetyltransferase n=1 Tax=Streptomyces sp. NPDC026673 TaxID=3155724 RepID=UPI0033C54B1C
MRIFLETERLRLRHFTDTDADAELLVALDSDPEVMRYLGNGRPTPSDVIRHEVLPRFARSSVWAAEELSTGQFVGWFALTPRPEGPADDLELGYRLRRAAWGRGYATEGSRALIHKAFTDLGAGRVYAETMFVNAGSRRVMEKAGLRFVRVFHEAWDEPLPGAEQGEVEYALTREGFVGAG